MKRKHHYAGVFTDRGGHRAYHRACICVGDCANDLDLNAFVTAYRADPGSCCKRCARKAGVLEPLRWT